MSLPVGYRAEALDDIDDAYAAYEQRSAGAGEQFLEALRQLVERIADSPNLYGAIYRDVRAAPLRRFPYVVFYRAEANGVLVIAVQHGRRSWRGWKGRV